MNDLSGARVVVVGAGVLGLAVAAEAAARGARCTVFDPAPLGENASGVAAGMLAPAFESTLDPLCADRFELFRAARDLWPSFADRHGLPPPDRSGAVWIDPSGRRDPADVAGRLRTRGAQADVLSGEALTQRVPGIAAGEGVFTPDDWRIEVGGTLEALLESLLRQGGELRRVRVDELSEHCVVGDGTATSADAVVVCAGPSTAAFGTAAPELAVLRPVKGEILRFDAYAPAPAAPVVRAPEVYLVPSRAGLLAGATMTEGAADLEPTAAAGRSLHRAAAAVLPGLEGAAATHRVGVRAATPDGLPLAGRSRSGVWLAAGARRNGWLLAPLVARIVADGLVGRDPGAWAEALRPGRFDA